MIKGSTFRIRVYRSTIAAAAAAAALVGSNVGLAASAFATGGEGSVQPTFVSVSSGPGSASVTWSPATPPTGGTVLNYVIHYTDRRTLDTTDHPKDSGTTADTANGLIGGDTYDVTMTVFYSDESNDPATNAEVANPTAVPTAPTGVTATVGSTPGTAGQATVSWTAPTDTGGLPVTGYTVDYTDTTTNTQGSVSGGGASATSKTITGLHAGDAYSFVVVATNADGDGPASTPPATANPVDVPGQPTNLHSVAGPGGAQATVTWTAPAAHGSPITGYAVRHIDTSDNTGSHDATVQVGAGATSSTATALVPGDVYSFTVTATNAVGTGVVSHASNTSVPFTTPSAPSGVTATGGDGTAQVTWVAPAAANGSPITGYRVVYTDAATPADNGSFVSAGTGTSATVPALVGGETYVFTVRAANAAGDGTASAASAPLAVTSSPDAPTGVTATAGPAGSQATVSWTAPANAGGTPVTGYRVTLADGVDPATIVTTDAATLSAVVGGLQPGVPYTVTVTATNAVGTGGAGTAAGTVTPFTVPGAPTGVTGVRGDTTVAVSWTAPSSPGSPVTGYTVSWVDSTDSGGSGTTALPSPATATTVTGLTDGDSYTFTVTATNAAGTGAASTASAPVTPATGPGVPTTVVGTPLDTAVGLSWTAPASTGGSPVTGYLITATDTSNLPVTTTTSTTTGPGTTGTVTGLVNGDSYTFTVAAINSVGTGAASDPSAAVTPATVAGAPTGVTAVRGYRSVTLSWTAPTDDGGTPVTTYKLFLYDATSPGRSNPNGYVPAGQGTATTATIAGLFPGDSYTFKVEAVNAAGTSVLSAASNSVAPYTVPNAPTGVAGVRGDASIGVTWAAPASDGGSPITGYQIDATDTATALVTSITAAAGATAGTLTGLTNGDPYTVTVTALNAGGAGAASTASTVTPATLPGQPAGVHATAAGSGATVTWTAATDGGAPISDYTVTWTDLSDQTGDHDGSVVSPGAGTLASVPGLLPGDDYFFLVTATNSVGSGPVSHESNTVTPFDVPIAPTSVTATAGSSSLLVSWEPSAGDGGSTITGYRVTATAGPFVTIVNTDAGVSTATLPGLVAGAAYTVTVVAENAAGSSAAGTASGTTTPYTTPGAPTSVTAVATPDGADVSWAAPSTDGGRVVTGYQVSWVDTADVAGSGTSAVLGASVLTDHLPLTVGHSYTVTVAALNIAGTGTSSTPTAAVVPYTVPGAPTGLTATSADGAVDLSWTAPADGFNPINEYVIAWTDTSDLSTAHDGNTTAPGAALSSHIAPLVNGDIYTFTVTATNSAGAGPVSATSAPVTPATVPDAPTAVSAVAGESRATVSWTPPADTGGTPISGYVVSWIDGTDVGGNGVSPLLGPGTTAVIAGLVPGHSYTFTVTATTSVGAGAASAPTTAVTPYTVPGVPSGVTGTRHDSSVALAWAAPVDGGSVLTGYTITATDTATDVVTTSTADGGAPGVTVTGLSNGDSYTFTVAAVNAAGTGLASAAAGPFTPATVPGLPTAVTATAGHSGALVSWSAPVVTGGSAVTGYTITWTDLSDATGSGQVSPVGTATTATISPLVPGADYTFTVTAANAVGDGAASVASTSVTPYTVPSAPTAVTAVAGPDGAPVVGWTAPADGFSPLTGYVVAYTDSTHPAGSGQVTAAPDAVSLPVGGLVVGDSYTFAVTATNLAGVGAPSAATGPVVAHGVPTTPTDALAVATESGATVTWAAPVTPADTVALTGYVVVYTDVTHVGPSHDVTDAIAAEVTSDAAALVPGDSYDVTVAAANQYGTGPAAGAGTVVPFTVPGAPTRVTGVAGDTTATITWSAPVNTGYTAVTGYDVIGLDTSTSTTVPTVHLSGAGTRTATVNGLTDGDPYTFTVVADNVAGSSAASAPSAAVTPQLPALSVASTTLPTRVAVTGRTFGVPFTVTLNRPGPVTVSLRKGTSVLSRLSLPAGRATVAATYGLGFSNAAQLGGFTWVVTDTVSGSVLLSQPVQLGQPSRLAVAATRAGNPVTVTGSATYSSLATGRPVAWTGQRVLVQRNSSTGWITLRAVTTDDLGHLRVTLLIPFRVGLRLVDADSGAVLGTTSSSVVL